MNYARGIQAARTHAALSKTELARSAGLDPSFITHLESGQKQPSVQTLEAISEATSVPVAVIMLMASDDTDLAEGFTSVDAMLMAERMLGVVQRKGRSRGTTRGKRRAGSL